MAEDGMKEDERKDYGSIKLRSWGEIIQAGIHKENIRDRVDAMTIVKPFIIKEIDLLTLKEFVKYCRMNTKGDWGMGISTLLREHTLGGVNTILYEKLLLIEERMEYIEGNIAGMVGEEKKEDKKKTFGGE